jgi:hypothetical protein
LTIESILTKKYLINKVLSSKSEDDLSHIAFAVANNIDYIISWNFKHFVNIKTTKMVNATNLLINYKSIEIITPSMIVGGEENE